MAKHNSLEAISTSAAPAAIGPYSQGVAIENLLFISGQLPLDPKTGEFVEGGIEERTHQIIKNIKAIAEAAEADLSQVVKTTIFLNDMADFPVVNRIYAKYFDKTPPARSTIQVAALPKNADIEMEAIVHLSK